MIETQRLQLIPYSPEHLLALIEGADVFERRFGLPAADGLRRFVSADYVSPEWVARLRVSSGIDPWQHGFAVVDRVTRTVVGTLGFKGPPDDDGVVEIGYGIAPAFEGRGYATEAARAGVRFAFERPDVRRIRAHTLPEPNPSTSVLKKCGFTWLGEVDDPADGRVWRWERDVVRVAAVTIRPYTPDDADAVFESVRESLDELTPWMPWCHVDYSPDESRSWIAAQRPAFQAGLAFEFAIVSADGRHLGGCGLNQLDIANRRANLGYWVRSAATRLGVATAAVRQLRDWAFRYTDLVRLEIIIAAENVGSRRVAEKAGALFEGVLRHRLLLHGAAHDATIFSFTRADAGGD